MSPLAKQLLPCLEALTKNDRAELAEYLLETLDEEAPIATEAVLDSTLMHRVEEIRAGRIEGVPAADLYARLRSGAI